MLSFSSRVTEFFIHSSVQNLQSAHYIRAVLYHDDIIVVFPFAKLIV